MLLEMRSDWWAQQESFLCLKASILPALKTSFQWESGETCTPLRYLQENPTIYTRTWVIFRWSGMVLPDKHFPMTHLVGWIPLWNTDNFHEFPWFPRHFPSFFPIFHGFFSLPSPSKETLHPGTCGSCRTYRDDGQEVVDVGVWCDETSWGLAPCGGDWAWGSSRCRMTRFAVRPKRGWCWFIKVYNHYWV